MKTMLSVALMACALLALAAPARAEHNGQAPARDSVDLNLDLKIGGEGFRLGGTVFGLEGVYGAWLNGAVRPDGFSVDGRLQHPERAYNFKLNADVGGWPPPALPPFVPVGYPRPGGGGQPSVI